MKQLSIEQYTTVVEMIANTSRQSPDGINCVIYYHILPNYTNSHRSRCHQCPIQINCNIIAEGDIEDIFPHYKSDNYRQIISSYPELEL